MSAPREIAGVIVDADERIGDGGFLLLRRLRLRNRRTDGSVSAPYVCDSVERPYGQDAVVVAIFARAPGGTRVLVRDGMRPPLVFGRDVDRAPLPEPLPSLFLTELVAGILEAGDHGEAGLRARAAYEALEEAGYRVDPARIIVLGAGMYPTPGMMPERFYFVAAEVDPAVQEPLVGDGSPMEEGARTRWLDLDEAIAACVAGEISDLKTEACLRRLRDHLAAH